MSTVTVTTWWLEQNAPENLQPAHIPDTESGIRIARAEIPSPEFSRFLYTAVGGDVTWTDRLDWSLAEWRAFLDRPGVETWVAYDRGTPAGFIELDGGAADGVVEISYFGLIPAFRGRRIGGHLLSYGTARAWDLAERWDGCTPTGRVWVHTCSKDGPHALANYERRGFRRYDTTTAEEPAAAPPGPWPGAHGGANPR
ncbi:GNAT family N-acetyltransferase [Streptomyces armeniacus]|uniref:GNAT family N-acetyltransferase n=1 Tax=Streptomyces armeniacus TaxID=83291 RepID=A0A345XXF6_9ACTN|nr:GNAT family N-acetyltransferase [Streptomyces armeniacus]AXK36322.1 GNAT family N-acetyltransferase [Streptomyces armeniacus]